MFPRRTSRALLVPQRQVLGNVLVLIDARLDLHRAVHQLLFRELVKNQVAQVIAVASRGHPTDQIVLAPRSERKNQQKLRRFLPGQSGHDVSGLHGFGLRRLAEQVMRDIPDVFLVVKHLRVVHVKCPVGLGLRLKQGFGIAGVAAQVGRHFGSGLEQFWEKMLVGLNDGIARDRIRRAIFSRSRHPPWPSPRCECNLRRRAGPATGIVAEYGCEREVV